MRLPRLKAVEGKEWEVGHHLIDRRTTLPIHKNSKTYLMQTFVLFVKEMLNRLASWLNQSAACALTKTLAGPLSRKRSALIAGDDRNDCDQSIVDDAATEHSRWRTMRFRPRGFRSLRVAATQRNAGLRISRKRFFPRSFFSPTPVIIESRDRQRSHRRTSG